MALYLVIARRLGLTSIVPLRGQDGPRQCKIVVFVPDQDLAKVSDALFAAGAGHIGQYSQCSFRLAGTGTFFGSESSNPTLGVKGRREEVNEWRLEAICPEAALERAIAALRQAHSYEEPAYDAPLSCGRRGRRTTEAGSGACAAAYSTPRSVKRYRCLGGRPGDGVVSHIASKSSRSDRRTRIG